MQKKAIGLIIGAAALIGAGAYLLRPQAAATAGPGAGGGRGAGGAGGPPTVVSVVAPARRDVPVVLQASGSVTPVSTVVLHPQTTSTVSRVHIREGQFVKTGQLMFSLDGRAARAELAKAGAQVARARAAVADLERQRRRSEELVAQKFIAQSALDTLSSQLEAARAGLAAEQAALQSARVGESHGAIRAPMEGRVGAIDIHPGALVQPGTALATVTQLDPINVGFTLPESALADLLAAQRAGPVAVSAGTARGTLSFIDNQVDPVAGAIRVKARFDNRDASLWPGQYVTARVTLRTIRGALVLPQTAIVTNPGGTFVYVVDPDQSARQVPVGRVHPFGAEVVVSGLAGGELVITDGKQNLRPGGKVKLAGKPGGKGGADGADGAEGAGGAADGAGKPAAAQRGAR
ncbi:efflux RND transporter periplasmic adaptor subunit [Massilia glaciei]|uniref:Efflux RND transporter periplasmic adaptor subunit n=1 Tax=Massilia glaciei TaxID=1524097 RepID=A0A2U2I4Y0_9BURK|nr:efflux RND transporter periplasmic adaptor subunit [Massilia glaciei]PWF54850.1 efflux RND transporter periplasmic adaptor subunit [Massilia glaciei]